MGGRQCQRDEGARLARRRRDLRSSPMSRFPPTPWLVGQTSLPGSMHLALNPAPGVAPSGRLTPGSTLAVQAVDLPVDRTTLSVPSVVSQRWGSRPDRLTLSSTSSTARQRPRAADPRSAATAQTTVGVLATQRDAINATGRPRSTGWDLRRPARCADRALDRIPPALDVLVAERPNLTVVSTSSASPSAVATGGCQMTIPGRPGSQPAQPGAHSCARWPMSGRNWTRRCHTSPPSYGQAHHRPRHPRRLPSTSSSSSTCRAAAEEDLVPGN